MQYVKIEALPQYVRRMLDQRLVERGADGYSDLMDWLGVQGYEVTRADLHAYWQRFAQRARDTAPPELPAPRVPSAPGRPVVTKFADVRRAARRRDLLLMAEQAPRIGLSEEMLALGLEGRGLAAGRAAVADDVTWLEAQGLVRTQDGDGQRIVVITQLGSDVARGVEEVAGVARPAPEGA
ncbi:MAG: DUF3486 family protein [Burkholderiales bacterium]|nr:DUF3486 family protein [Burkholderiales bacterium]